MSPDHPGLLLAVARYTGVVVLALAPGTVGLTSIVRRRWRVAERFSANSVYAVLTAVVGVTGCLVWPQQIRLPAAGDLVGAVVAGALLAWPVVLLDAAISRRLAAALTRQARAAAGTRSRPPAGGRARVVPAGIAGPGPARTSGPMPAPRSVAYRPRPSGTGSSATPTRSVDSVRRVRSRATLGWLMAVAVAEELLFRGAVLGPARLLPLPAAIPGCVGITVVFCLLHSGFGWHQVVAKVPLALGTLAVALAFHHVAGAVVLHCLFNAWYWRRNSWLASSPVGTVATA